MDLLAEQREFWLVLVACTCKLTYLEIHLRDGRVSEPKLAVDLVIDHMVYPLYVNLKEHRTFWTNKTTE